MVGRVNMSKTLEEMAMEYIRYDNESAYWTKHAFLAGYKAAQAIVEEELQAVQAQRTEYPGLGAAQYALKSVLAKMGSK